MKDDQPIVIYPCCFVENGKRCNSTKQPIRIHADGEMPQFWCVYHYEQRRKKSENEKKFEDGIEVLKAAAKVAAMSNYDYFREHLGLSDLGKLILEKVGEK